MHEISFDSREEALEWIYDNDPGGADIQLHPIDVGFDVKDQGIVVLVPRGTSTLYLLTEDGKHLIAKGNEDELVSLLHDHGFMAEVDQDSRFESGLPQP